MLALGRVPDLKPNSVIIMGTGDRRRQIKLKPIYVALGAERAAALPGFHSLTGSDTTGHIRGKGSHRASTVFMKADEDNYYLCSFWAWCCEFPRGVVWM